MLRWGLSLTAILIVLQIVVGDISGKYIYQYQPAKFAVIEARWHPEQPASELWLAIPDEKNRRNLFTVKTPYVGSWIATSHWTAPVSGLSDFPPEDWPPVLISFFSFRIMVGLGMLMLAVSWFGLWLSWRGRMETTHWFLRCTEFAFPSGFLAVIIGWITTEVGRQPWVVYGLLRTAYAVTPKLTGANVLTTLLGYLAVYTLIFLFGCWYLSGILRRGLIEAAGEITGAPSTSDTGIAVAKE